MSKLEKFIDNNRDEFDGEIPADKVWENIELAMGKKGAKKFVIAPLYKWSIAAGILIVISISIFFLKNNHKPDEVITAKNDTVDSTIYTIAPEEAPQMVQFAKLIETKQEELKVYSREQPELYKKFTSDFNQLDSSYNTLKTRLSQTPNKEMLIEAMIQNLQLQLNVLNQQLNIINQIKNLKSNSNEKNNQFM